MASFEKRVGSDGKVTWRVKVRRRGWPTLTCSFDRRGDGEAWAHERERELRRGQLVDLRPAQAFTLDKALERYGNEVSARKRSYKNEVKTIRLFRSSDLAQRTLANLRPADVAAWRDGRLNHGFSPYTVRNELALLSHLYTTAAREWGCEGLPNVVSMIKRPKPPAGRDRRLRPNEEKQLLATGPSLHPWLAPVIQWALATTMRLGEISSLTWGDIDLGIRVAHLRRSKNGDARDVPLSKAAMAVLKKLPNYKKHDADALVFGVRDRHISREFGLLADLVGCPDLRFHDLRHEAVSRLFERGLDSMQVAAISGHKTLTMLKRYTHLRAVDLVKLLD